MDWLDEDQCSTTVLQLIVSGHEMIFFYNHWTFCKPIHAFCVVMLAMPLHSPFLKESSGGVFHYVDSPTKKAETQSTPMLFSTFKQDCFFFLFFLFFLTTYGELLSWNLGTLWLVHREESYVHRKASTTQSRLVIMRSPNAKPAQ